MVPLQIIKEKHLFHAGGGCSLKVCFMHVVEPPLCERGSRVQGVTHNGGPGAISRWAAGGGAILDGRRCCTCICLLLPMPLNNRLGESHRVRRRRRLNTCHFNSGTKWRVMSDLSLNTQEVYSQNSSVIDEQYSTWGPLPGGQGAFPRF